MSPPQPPPRPAGVGRPGSGARVREETLRGMPTPSPTIRGADASDVVAELDRERERSAELLAQTQRLEREQRELAQARAKSQYVRSYSPPPDVTPTRVNVESPPSFRPGREALIGALRYADPRWVGVALVIGVLAWALGGREGAMEIIKLAKDRGAREDIAALKSELEAERGKRLAAEAARRAEEIQFRAYLAEVFQRQGVEWELDSSAPPTKQLTVEVPIRKPGVVTRGPALKVKTPMPIPSVQ